MVELSNSTEELLEKTGNLYIGLTERKKRMSYFLSKGTGMELWERLKSEGLTPEELESAKNELKRKGHLTVRKFESVPPYYYRFKGKLARITEYREKREDQLSTGHADITYTETRKKIYFKEETFREKDLNGTEEKIASKALKIRQEGDKEEEKAVSLLIEKGLGLKYLEESLEHEEDIDKKEIKEEIDQMEAKGLIDRDLEYLERRKAIWFVSEWKERAEKRTRFFFSPEIYQEYFQKEND